MKKSIVMYKEKIFKSCSNIVKDEVNNSLMGWIFRRPLFESIDNNLFFHKTIQDEIVGFCICKLMKRTNVIKIEKIGVQNEYRSQGIGFDLLNEVKKLGLPIRLDVVKKNKQAVDFYLRNGFEVIGKKTLGSDIDVLIMEQGNKTIE